MPEQDKYKEFKELPRKERRKRLLELFRKEGSMALHSDRELGRIFGVNVHTIQNDKLKISNLIIHEPNRKIAFEYNLNKLIGVKELLRIINGDSKDSDKINAINSLMSIAEKEISWRYKLGLIDIEPEKTEQVHKVTILQLAKIYDESKNESERISRIRTLVGI